MLIDFYDLDFTNIYFPHNNIPVSYSQYSALMRIYDYRQTNYEDEFCFYTDLYFNCEDYPSFCSSYCFFFTVVPASLQMN